MPKQELKWKFLRQEDRRRSITSEHGNEKWKVGEWHKAKGTIELCKNGYHCSDGILQALEYVKGEVLARVEVRGDSETDDDKSVHREMRVVKMYRWTAQDSVAFAIYAAAYADAYAADAAYAAYAAARAAYAAALRAKLERWLIKRVKTLEEIK